MTPAEIEERVSALLASLIRLQEEIINYQQGHLVHAGMLQTSLNKMSGTCMAVSKLLDGRVAAERAGEAL